ncbi:MAG: polyprenol monophosphomannose synthase [Chitinophagaceae bacterium]|nr:polyprenol monophosphomannose synthase [Chitinophagaceae bacterium]MCW5929201.1 polyprenol monophosphomannose synthase [Chitinophagaceae bacterium]
MEKLVVVPTYNECENIAAILKAIFEMNGGFHVLVVDDNSPDGTADVVRDLQQVYDDQLFLELRKGKEGLGTAYLHGFKWAIDKGYRYIFEMDADFSHNPKDLERLYQACRNGAGVAIGSRYVAGGKTVNWTWERNVLSKGGALYTRLLTWMPVKDPTAGFICYRKEVLESINFDEIKFVGYAFQIEMKFAAWKLGFRIVEIPITFVDRKYGTSKMNKNIVKEGILGVIKIQWLSMFKNYRRKVKSTLPQQSDMRMKAIG